MDNLSDIKDKIIHFCEDKFSIFSLEDSEHKEILMDFESKVKNKLNLEDGFRWMNNDFIKFLQMAEKNEVKTIYLCAPEITEQDITESEEFQSEKILSKHKGDISFIIIGFYLSNKFHYLNFSTDWFEEAREFYEGGSNENKIDEEDDEWEDLTEDDKENYGRKIAGHPDFSKFIRNYTTRKMFIRKNFPEIYKEVDDYGLNEIGNMAKFVYDTGVKNGNLSKM